MTIVTSRPLWRRLFGAFLVVYGAVGLLMVFAGVSLASGPVAKLDGLATTLETQRQVLIRSLDATATFLRDARTGTGNVQTSLTATVDSARQTATLTRNLASAMQQLAAASTIDILGSKPFEGLNGTFGAVADQAGTMGASLDRTADSLAVNTSDLGQVNGDLARIGTEIDALRQQVAGSSIGADDLAAATRALDTSRLVLLGLLAWIAVQGVIAIIAGIALFRWRTFALVPTVVADAGLASASVELPVDDVV